MMNIRPLIHPISARTSAPNTAASDLLPKVDHDVMVVVLDGSHEVVRIAAACPMTAIEAIRNISPADYEALPRVAQ